MIDTRFYTLVLLLITTIHLNATNTPTIFDALSYEEVVHINIEVDLENLTANWRSEEKHPALLTYKDVNGSFQNWDIQLKLRGKFRRMRCATTPPLKLYFDKEDLKAAGLAKYNDFKLVNYCTENSEIAKELIIKEYLAYKIYNELSEESFRVQLLKITYKDTKSGRKFKQFGFLIEDTAEMRNRINAKKYKAAQANGGAIPFLKEQMQLMSVFQYMIGNSDWRWEVEKNIKFVTRDTKVLAIPYDFDFSGLVHADYAVPNTNYGLTSLSERVYLGFLEDLDTIDPVLAHFESKKASIIDLVKTTKWLKHTAKREMLDYINSFYLNLSSETLTSSVRELRYSQAD